MATPRQIERREIRVEIAEDVARDAEAAGLLAPEEVERMLRAALARHGYRDIWEARDAGAFGSPMSDAEVVAEVRAERKRAHHR